MTLDLGFQILLGIVSAVFGLWVKELQKDITNLEKSVETIKTDYQRREDAKTNFDLMMATLRDVRVAIDRIDGKLDRKADK
ncbi:hypothetical protein ACULTK_004463 [Yersinia enterocolitica]|uniref:Uncharacterized protein n=1 Tax=Yersinia enterocolitica LC20 TaxID=1443113 RepID=A0A7U4GDH3_YEREN|nr:MULTISPECIES: hypothetical protein [Yersinia]AHM72410.1 hypothetical protein LC20_01156 [Yersinia hibernica]EKN3736467.1 hypothetical protein [Yersinia enterocolitica]EKN3780441.1 hypothetical protein [Yersinia enterocolitica]EKN3781879.1 hypothetical protein [Yersinia enterocolitica]EKN3971075.1 hypothetical protein [Yersinia enterocolitica]